MKTILNLCIALLLIIAGFLIGERVSNFKIPAGKVLISKAHIDSINSIKPDTVVRVDTITLEKIIFQNRPLPEPEPTQQPDIVLYSDSLQHEFAKLVIRDWIKGELIDREVEFTPYIIEKTVNNPYPVYVPYVEKNPYKPPNLEAFGGVLISRNPGIQIGLIHKKTYLSGQFDGHFGIIIGRKFTIF